MSDPIEHKGGCHCGAVRFTVMAPAKLQVSRCNCSICNMSGFLHLIISRENFYLELGNDALTTYTFNTGTARHLFCKHCGIKSFYVPRSHPDGYSVNVNCLQPDHIEDIQVRDFDGQNWEASIDTLHV